MQKFNDTNLITGYIKQLLKDFNLPKFKVYSKEQKKFKEDIKTSELCVVNSIYDKNIPSNIRNIWYIKDDNIQKYINGMWKKVEGFDCYTAGKKFKNYTKNLIINNTQYDSYTHEYLGNYLRFLRDYYGLDLMSMYNCFSNKVCKNLELSFKDPYAAVPASDVIDTRRTIEFNSYDETYKIYSIPVKLFKNYTIAIESDAPIEMCCGIYKDNLNTENDKWSSLYKYTYTKVACCQFSNPFIYDKLLVDQSGMNLSDESKLDMHDLNLVQCANAEDFLRLFIKIPVANKSSIVVLEGNYKQYSDTMLFQNPKAYLVTDDPKEPVQHPLDSIKPDTRLSNKYITNYNLDDRGDFKVDVNESVPSTEADYKPAIKITDDSDFEVFKPITRLQLLDMNTGISYPFADRLIGYLTGNTITELDEIDDNIIRAQKVIESTGEDLQVFGAWENKMRIIFYDYMKNTPKITNFNTDKDELGYIDKDVEKYYLSNNETGLTLNNINLYKDLYKDLYEEDK